MWAELKGTLGALAVVAVLPAAAQPAAVQVNQVGFLPGAAKWAAIPGARAEAFTVVDAATGAVVHRGTLGPARIWAPSAQTLRLADFSALTAPGRYRVQVEGLPPSAPFTVAADAYAALNAAALKAFYFNRASTELKPEHAGRWARPAGHPDTRVLVHASAVGPRRVEGEVISAPKGWYDAGDYNKYIVNSGISTYTLLAAWEHFPAHFRRQRLNIPESGGPLPDILAEVLWNLEWMLAMQDPADGGVYHKLTNKGFDATVMPHQATGERYVVMKGTGATLNFAAVMAAASRVYAAFDAPLAARTLAAAQRAWAWAQANPAVPYQQPKDIHTGGYDDKDFAGEFGWAAAELYITTRDDAFWRAIRAAELPVNVPWWGGTEGLAWMSLAHHRERLTPAADQRLIEERIRRQGAELTAKWVASPVRVALEQGDFNWGSNSGLLNAAMMQIQALRLGGDEGVDRRALLDSAQSALDYVLGRNALALSMVTGFGTHAVRHPHHRPSEADGVADPVPGFIAGGPNAGQQDAQHCPVPYASKLPALSFLDHYCSYASNEVTINWNAPLVYLSAALQMLTPQQLQQPQAAGR